MKKKNIYISIVTLIFTIILLLCINYINKNNQKHIVVNKTNISNTTEEDIKINKIEDCYEKSNSTEEEIIILLNNKLIKDRINTKVPTTEVYCLDYEKYIKINNKNYHKLHYYKINNKNKKKTHINYYYIEDTTHKIYTINKPKNILKKIL